MDGDSRIIVYVDLPESLPSDKPPAIDGYYPDLYCAAVDGQPVYVGEAKTVNDLESRHSRDQLAAYLRFLSVRGTGSLVVAVPWRAVPSARSLVRSIQRLNGTRSVPTFFLERLPG